MSLRGRRFTWRECKGPVESMVSVVRVFEVRRGRSSPIETEARGRMELGFTRWKQTLKLGSYYSYYVILIVKDA